MIHSRVISVVCIPGDYMYEVSAIGDLVIETGDYMYEVSAIGDLMIESGVVNVTGVVANQNDLVLSFDSNSQYH